MTDIEFLDQIEHIARTKSRIDPDFKDLRVHLSARQGTRIYELTHNSIVRAGMPSSWYRCDTLLERWIPAARANIAEQVARKLIASHE